MRDAGAPSSGTDRRRLAVSALVEPRPAGSGPWTTARRRAFARRCWPNWREAGVRPTRIVPGSLFSFSTACMCKGVCMCVINRKPGYRPVCQRHLQTCEDTWQAFWREGAKSPRLVSALRCECHRTDAPCPRPVPIQALRIGALAAVSGSSQAGKTGKTEVREGHGKCAEHGAGHERLAFVPCKVTPREIT